MQTRKCCSISLCHASCRVSLSRHIEYALRSRRSQHVLVVVYSLGWEASRRTLTRILEALARSLALILLGLLVLLTLLVLLVLLVPLMLVLLLGPLGRSLCGLVLPLRGGVGGAAGSEGPPMGL
jgi:hypothetical protein